MYQRLTAMRWYLIALLPLLAVLSCEKDKSAPTDMPDDGHGDYIVDERDGNRYAVVKIGKQVWMAENLRYFESVTSEYSDTEPCTYVFMDAAGSREDILGSAVYWSHGIYYNFHAALNGEEPLSPDEDRIVRGVCPEGWHIPSVAEWQELLAYVVDNRLEAKDEAGNIISGATGKALASTSGWDVTAGGNPEPEEGSIGVDQHLNNATGFNGKPCGFRAGDEIRWYHDKYSAGWWSSDNDADNENFAYPTRMWADTKGFYVGKGASEFIKGVGLPVRCVKDS